MTHTKHTVVFVRHGHSEWNLHNRFTGWTNIPLTEQGLGEAKQAGQRLAELDLMFDEAHVSVLTRTRQTAEQLLAGARHPSIPYAASWRLNERHYGALQGMNKQEIFSAWGEEQSRKWWRGYYDAPPPLAHDDPRHPRFDPIYDNLDRAQLPSSESLADCQARTLVYWNEVLQPRLLSGRRLLVVSHGNTLRGIVMHIKNIGPADIERVEIPSAIPLLCEFDNAWNLLMYKWLE